MLPAPLFTTEEWKRLSSNNIKRIRDEDVYTGGPELSLSALKMNCFLKENQLLINFQALLKT